MQESGNHEYDPLFSKKQRKPEWPRESQQVVPPDGLALVELHVAKKGQSIRISGNKGETTMRNLMHLSVACICIIFCIVMVSGCASQVKKQEVMGAEEKKFFVDILPPKDAIEHIQKNKVNSNFVIVDVRTPEEFQDGHIEGAINVDFRSGNFPNEIDRLDKNKTYFVYCRTGNRSYDAVAVMGPLGFRSIVRLDGDITGWKSAGLPVVK
jgi:rhodanese-related sulfurtransferase